MDDVGCSRVADLVEERMPRDASPPGPDDDLFAAGLDSVSAVGLLFELEEAFGIDFPAERITAALFSSISQLCTVVDELARTTLGEEAVTQRLEPRVL